MDRYGRLSGERRSLCGELRGRQGIFVILGQRQGMPGWTDNPVQGHTGQPTMA